MKNMKFNPPVAGKELITYVVTKDLIIDNTLYEKWVEFYLKDWQYHSMSEEFKKNTLMK